mmetsp:Transcript_24298/g.95629  ORF Transcript_24298/g.95629 Transcript_24298/m.95629 type:complete len:83 (-) Transcript_24298:198-446(-)
MEKPIKKQYNSFPAVWNVQKAKATHPNVLANTKHLPELRSFKAYSALRRRLLHKSTSKQQAPTAGWKLNHYPSSFFGFSADV